MPARAGAVVGHGHGGRASAVAGATVTCRGHGGRATGGGNPETPCPSASPRQAIVHPRVAGGPLPSVQPSATRRQVQATTDALQFNVVQFSIYNALHFKGQHMTSGLAITLHWFWHDLQDASATHGHQVWNCCEF
ncbi:unnamed protein product [Urochloa humidicola]